MGRNNNVAYSEKIKERIKKLMSLSGLELAGFAEYTGISESHIYAILNGNREFTNEVADKIATGFNIKPENLFKPSVRLTKRVLDEKKLKKFYEENKGVVDYFSATREQRKVAYYFEHHLLSSGLFDSPVSIAVVRELCKEEGKDFSSKRISQILKYLVDNKKLRSKKRPIKLKSGKSGHRMVDYYYK